MPGDWTQRRMLLNMRMVVNTIMFRAPLLRHSMLEVGALPVFQDVI